MRRLLAEDIERGTGQMTGVKSGCDGSFVHQFAAGAVEQARTGLHLRQGRGVDQPRRLMCERQVQREVVGAGKDLVGRDEFDAELLGARRGEIGIAADDLHAEDLGATRNLGANAADSEDAEGFAGQLGTLQALLLPLAGARGVVGLRNVAGHGEHESEGEFGNGRGAGAGSVHHHNAAARGGLHVNVVNAHACAANHTQFGRKVNERGIGLHGRAHNERIRPLHGLGR